MPWRGSRQAAGGVAHYEEALRIKPEQRGGAEQCRGALCRTGHFDEAIAHWEMALKIDPGFTEARDKPEPASGQPEVNGARIRGKQGPQGLSWPDSLEELASLRHRGLVSERLRRISKRRGAVAALVGGDTEIVPRFGQGRIELDGLGERGDGAAPIPGLVQARPS